jgi:predicted RecB family nuclease
MFKVDQALRLSAADLVGHLNCRHLTHLDCQVANGLLRHASFRDPMLEILWERGAMHERNYLEHLAACGQQITRIESVGITTQLAAQTLRAMQAGAQIIAQAALLHEPWSGRADILRRVAVPSRLGDWSYEVIDTKLARETKGATLLQLCLYADLLANVQGRWPEFVHVVTPATAFQPQPYRTAAYAAYYRHVRRSLEHALAAPAASYPEPKEHCDICHWRAACDARRRQDDHACLVAGITKLQTAQLQRRNIDTAAALAAMPIPLQWKPIAAYRNPTSGHGSRRACRSKLVRPVTQFSSSCPSSPDAV